MNAAPSSHTEPKCNLVEWQIHQYIHVEIWGQDMRSTPFSGLSSWEAPNTKPYSHLAVSLMTWQLCHCAYYMCLKLFIDIFYKLVKFKLRAQYDPKIGMFRSNCLKVYGMSISYQVLLSKSVPHTFRQYILRIYGHTRTHFQLLYGRSVTVCPGRP